MNEILTTAECSAADRHAVTQGTPFLTLMENAGRAVAQEVVKRFTARRALVLCGPGNNGGDGWVAARILKQYGWPVRVAVLGGPASLEGASAAMARRWDDQIDTLSETSLADAELVIDALFGAGLSRPLDGAAKEMAQALKQSGLPVVAVDVPSGLHGDLAKVLGDTAIEAVLTITFFRKKPAHLLLPGRLHCGEVVLADIGIPESALDALKPSLFENTPTLWQFPWPRAGAHKYARGHCVVVSGPAHATGAARLAARGALRIGAGLVSVASPPEAVPVNAAALTAIMVKPFDSAEGLTTLLSDRRLNSVILGPGLGTGPETKELVRAALAEGRAAVLDADALTAFRDTPAELFTLLHPGVVLTPHEGEFERIFPGLLAASSTRIEATRNAATRAGCTLLLKGADTVIAAPDGRTAINANAPPSLATAGSGDVLAGFIGGLLAQGLPPFEAASAGTWLHGEAATAFGPGLIAEDLPEQLPGVLAALPSHPGKPLL